MDHENKGNEGAMKFRFVEVQYNKIQEQKSKENSYFASYLAMMANSARCRACSRFFSSL